MQFEIKNIKDVVNLEVYGYDITIYKHADGLQNFKITLKASNGQPSMEMIIKQFKCLRQYLINEGFYTP